MRGRREISRPQPVRRGRRWNRSLSLSIAHLRSVHVSPSAALRHGSDEASDTLSTRCHGLPSRQFDVPKGPERGLMPCKPYQNRCHQGALCACRWLAPLRGFGRFGLVLLFSISVTISGYRAAILVSR